MEKLSERERQRGKGVVYPGEAPETDEEESESEAETPTQSGPLHFRPTTSRPRPVQRAPKYRKESVEGLGVGTRRLENSLLDFVGRETGEAERELGSTAVLIQKTQESLQNTSYSIRTVADTLYNLNEHFQDLLSAHTLIPKFDDPHHSK